MPIMQAVHYNPDLQLLCCAKEHLTRWSFKSLSAPFWRFYWNMQAGAYLTFKGERIDLSPDMFYLIPPDTDCGAELDGPVDHLYLHFTAREPYYTLKPEIFAFPLGGQMLELAVTISEGLSSQERNDQRFSVQSLALLYSALAQVPAERLRLHRTDDRVDRVLEYMELRLERKQSNEELAKVANMHVNSFTRLFRMVTGYSPQRYLNMKRVERACIILHNLSVSIEEVAEALGFCDRYHFSRVFKQIRGMGPAAFQKTLILANDQVSK